jgi:hypothetical protein
MSAFVRHGKTHYDECGYFDKVVFFSEPIMSDIELMRALTSLLSTVYLPGYKYTQGGIALANLPEAFHRQRRLLA